MSQKINRNYFSIVLSKTILKLSLIFIFGFFVATQITFSPVIDCFIKFFLRSYIGLELPQILEKIPFKYIFLFWFLIMFVFIIKRILKTGITVWLIENKEKIFITLLIISSQFIALTGGKLEISDFTALSILFLWCIYTIADKEYKIIWTPLYISLLFFFLSILLSVVNGGQMSFFKLPAVLKSITVFFLMINMIRNREITLFSLKIFISITTLSAIIGIFQEIIYFYTGIEIVGVINEDAKRFMWETTSYGTLMRIPAFTSWYTILANYLSIALIIGINIILYPILKKKEKIFLYIAMILMSIALYLTFSYSSILIVLSAFFISIMIRWPSLRIYLPVFLGLILLGFFSGFIPDFLSEPKKYFITEDLAIRIELLRDGITGFLNRHPLIGNGIGTGHRYTSNVDLWPVHNNFILIADELGLFGLFAYCIFFSIFIFRQAITILKLKNIKDKAVSLSLFLAFIAYLINLQVQAQHIDFFIFLYMGLTEAINSTLSHYTAESIT